MSRVGFVDDAKLAYVSCPLKFVVDLTKTKMDACIPSSSSAVQPAPMTTIAGSINLRNIQFFDITALVQEMDETRIHDNNRSSFAVKIYDGSLDDSTKKIKTLPLTVYFDTKPSTTDAEERHCFLCLQVLFY